MTEKGFYCEGIGYWQAIGSEVKIASYPSGTKEVPVCPGPGYIFNGNEWVSPSQTWLTEQAAKYARNERSIKLKTEVDPIMSNFIRWGEMTIEKQNEWIKYRRDLLDITEQENFPSVVIWPNPPS
jgi:hypothetical protein